MAERLYAERDTEMLADLYEQHLGAVYEEGLAAPEHIAAELAYRDDQIERLKLQLANAEGRVRDDAVVREHWWRLVVQEPFDEYLEAHPASCMDEATAVFKAWCHVHDHRVLPLTERIEALESGVRGITWSLMQDFRPAITRVAKAPHSPFELVSLVNDLKRRALGLLQDGPASEEGS
mgnify:CR=1 FL=1|tara:strand:- start:1564 stop:2097 length:534 start_codon:yes stop_codon:yes gene_type:complete